MESTEIALAGTAALFIDAHAHDTEDDGYAWSFTDGTIKIEQGSIGISKAVKPISVNWRMFHATLAALIMALRKFSKADSQMKL